ncbi:hypothetical protein N656DRAFT_643911 [Canariomyces notabilis]|uniref:Uncharacterized protein n=1 Tax=Canariomyces notabilis TaxID=2074819 RepID=A0AAN6YSV7_9PEZI|nr:hypothetical protein N656DRAFT_643911 [Canariomyces arenarius]
MVLNLRCGSPAAKIGKHACTIEYMFSQTSGLSFDSRSFLEAQLQSYCAMTDCQRAFRYLYCMYKYLTQLRSAIHFRWMSATLSRDPIIVYPCSLVTCPSIVPCGCRSTGPALWPHSDGSGPGTKLDQQMRCCQTTEEEADSVALRKSSERNCQQLSILGTYPLPHHRILLSGPKNT